MKTKSLSVESPNESLITSDDVKGLDAYWRAANYLAAAQVYLRGNYLLEEPLKPEHIKNRLLGHWGTVPGINFIYAHLNRLIRRHDLNILLLTGPGHGAPANLANLYLEGSLAEFYPDLGHSRTGIENLISRFSIPGGFPSHLYPGTPGCIHEGGELGYALATAYGAVLDNPDLIATCIVGDGEAETGPTATAWHSAKMINPAKDGAVLPILHLNRYKISAETIFGAMTDDELLNLFRGYGYEPTIVTASGENLETRIESHYRMDEALEDAFTKIRSIQKSGKRNQSEERQFWPMLILRSPKGWTGPKKVDGKLVEGSFRSHQVPAGDCKSNPAHLTIVEKWLRSYHIEELFGEEGPKANILATCPQNNRRMGMNPHSFGGKIRTELKRPDFHQYACEFTQPGSLKKGDMGELGKYLRDVIRLNEEAGNFRIFCPDEMTSNRLGAVFEATNRQFEWPTAPEDDFMGHAGRVIEMLSEHNCQGWLQGYLLTGRHGLFPCYEAFAPIVDSMMNQFAKFLKVSSEISWRKPVSSLTYLLTSEGWRQDHNGYSHQGPGFINNLLTRKAQQARIYLPPDTNCLLSTVDHCLTSTDKINLVIASKQPMPQWLSMEEAIRHCQLGASIWRWASSADGENPDIVLAAAGVYLTAEAMAAAALLRQEWPELRVRVVNVTDLLILEPDTYHPHGLTQAKFEELFTADRPVIFNFHGYPGAVKQLLFNRPNAAGRFQINGYIEEGTTTTPFDMMVVNKASRFHIIIQGAQAAALNNPALANRANTLISHYENKLAEHRSYIKEHGADLPEIENWQWV